MLLKQADITDQSGPAGLLALRWRYVGEVHHRFQVYGVAVTALINAPPYGKRGASTWPPDGKGLK